MDYALIGGGRTNFLVLLFAVFFVFMITGIKLKFKYVFSLCVFSLFIYVVISYFSAFRFDMQEFSLDTIREGASIFNENFVTYLVLPHRLFDYALQNDYLSQIGGYHYGLVSFDGINRYLRLFLRLFSIDIPAIYEKTTAMFQDTRIFIGGDSFSNYAYTNAIYHYLDFGIVGVFVIPFSFSLFIRWVIIKFYKTASVSSFCLLFYLYFVLMNCFSTWHLNKFYSLGFILFMVCVMCYDKNVLYRRINILIKKNM